MARISPMQRTLAWLRKEKVQYWVVESYNAFSRKKKDLFGIIDVCAFFNTKLIGIQVCGKDWSAHMKKIKSSQHGKLWIVSGNGLWLIGWRKLKSGWESKVHVFGRDDFRDTQPKTTSLQCPDISSL